MQAQHAVTQAQAARCRALAGAMSCPVVTELSYRREGRGICIKMLLVAYANNVWHFAHPNGHQASCVHACSSCPLRGSCVVVAAALMASRQYS